MFSRTVEYALRAVVHLAYEAPEARTTTQIAEATQVPRDYLSKILQGLSKKGIVQTQRGVGGGPPGDLGEHAQPPNSRAAATVSATCSSVCASDGIAASNWDGAR